MAAPECIRVCAVDDVQSGCAKEFTVLDKSILLAREGDEYYAVSNKCTHYGASLSKGSYCNGRVRCPWHGALFAVNTGDIEDYPGFDSLHSFKTHIADGSVFVTIADRALLNTNKREKCIQLDAATSETVVVIIGSGAAAASCALTLRDNEFKGPIVIISKDVYPPYDRPKLSKALNATAESIFLKPASFYEQASIELRLGTEVINVDAHSKEVQCVNGEKVKYNYLVVATGGEPRRLQCAGADECNAIHYLRNPDDAHKLAAAVEGRRLVIAGSSFIGMELASALVSKASSVTVTAPESPPFSRVFGAQIGEAVQNLFLSKNVHFHLGHGAAKEIRKVDAGYQLILTDSSSLEFDVLAVGIGVTPCTKFLNTTPVTMTEQGQVKVDATMLSADPHIYACGDIAAFPLGRPLMMDDNTKVNVQHWQMALKHGHIAGLHIASSVKSPPCALTVADTRTVPFFWSVLFGKSLRYTGYSAGYESMIISGDVAALNFVVYYIKHMQVVAVATCQRDPVAAHFANMFHNGTAVPASVAQQTADDKDSNDANYWQEYMLANAH